METLNLSRSAARLLRAQLVARKSDLAAEIDRGADNACGRAVAVDFIDALTQELASDEAAQTDDWAAARQGRNLDLDLGRYLVLACATIAASWRLRREGPAIAAYLALRGRTLDRVCASVTDAYRAGTFSAPIERSEVVVALLTALAARDAATCHHSQAVGSWAARIARAFEMTDAECDHVELSGTLHDVGKLSTPRAILLKAGPLDSQEWDVMREHSAIGAQILADIPSLRACAPTVRAHHEQIDGNGYPDRLDGDRLPLAARIVAVADAFHAMISKRSYRPAMPAAEALAVLQRGAGTRWDVRVVDVMLGVVRPVRVRANVAVVGLRAPKSRSRS